MPSSSSSSFSVPSSPSSKAPRLSIPRVEDFAVDGTAQAAQWDQTDWQDLSTVRGQATYATRTKLLYSSAGLYATVDCTDTKLTCTLKEDNLNLYTEDVVELFFQPIQGCPIYFEYELSPLNYELPIIIPNFQGQFHGWLPWHYTGSRRVQHAVSVQGGDQASGASVTSWRAELFIPFDLFKGYGHPPKSGDCWYGNVYRIDYDVLPSTGWALFPETGPNFHNYAKFGCLEFQ